MTLSQFPTTARSKLKRLRKYFGAVFLQMTPKNCFIQSTKTSLWTLTIYPSQVLLFLFHCDLWLQSARGSLYTSRRYIWEDPQSYANLAAFSSNFHPVTKTRSTSGWSGYPLRSRKFSGPYLSKITDICIRTLTHATSVSWQLPWWFRITLLGQNPLVHRGRVCEVSIDFFLATWYYPLVTHSPPEKCTRSTTKSWAVFSPSAIGSWRSDLIYGCDRIYVSTCLCPLSKWRGSSPKLFDAVFSHSWTANCLSESSERFL